VGSEGSVTRTGEIGLLSAVDRRAMRKNSPSIIAVIAPFAAVLAATLVVAGAEAAPRTCEPGTACRPGVTIGNAVGDPARDDGGAPSRPPAASRPRAQDLAEAVGAAEGQEATSPGITESPAPESTETRVILSTSHPDPTSPANLVTNWSVEENLSKHGSLRGATITRSNTWARFGSFSANVVTPGRSTLEGVWNGRYAVLPASSYTVSAWIYAPSQVRLRLGHDEFSASGSWIGSANSGEIALAANEVRQIWYETTTKSSAAAATLWVMTSGQAQRTSLFVDGWYLAPAGAPPPPPNSPPVTTAPPPPPNSPPVTTAPPEISGTPQLGQSLTASTGIWAHAPTSYAYQWRRCDSAGTSCVSISGATARSYSLVSADIGATIRVVVTASNAFGSTSASSAATTVVSGQPPVNTALPQITGTPRVGQILAASTGSWTGAPTSYSYQWRRCDGAGQNCVSIPGATAQSYLLVVDDAGSTIRVRLTATNSGGSASATSSQTGVVGALSLPGTRLFTAGFETGNFSEIVGRQESSPGRIGITTSVLSGAPLQGLYSVRVRNGAQDQGVAGSGGNYRTEMYVKRFGDVQGGGSLEGKELWIAWDMMVDPSFPTPDGWAILTQFHSYGSPTVAFTVDRHDRLLLEMRGGPLQSNGHAGNYGAYVLQPSLTRGQRISVKIWIRWSTSSSGRAKVWINGALKQDLTRSNLVAGYEDKPYMKSGVYRNDAPAESVVFFDQIRWASGEGGL
jgi:hypothetical protein